MSLLLDALNKADQERKRAEEAPNINSNHDKLINYRDSHKTPVLVVGIGIGALFSFLILGGYWLANRLDKPEIQSTTTSTTPFVATNVLPANVPVASTTQNPPPTTQSIKSTAAPTPTEALPPIELNESTVESLYQQQSATQKREAIQPNRINNQNATPTGVAGSGTAVSINQFANLPDLHDLPQSVLEKIPSMNYTEHHFNINGGSVVINGNVVHANDQFANGLVVDKILTDGMIMHIDNYSFKMRALNSWINM